MKKSNLKSGFSLIELSVVIIIIGILIAGVSQGTRLIAESRLKSARNLTASSPVNIVADIAFWIDATDSENLATGSAGSGVYNNSPGNGDFISDIKDRSPTGTSSIIFSAPFNDRRPIYIEKGIGDLPTMQFDGADDYLLFSGSDGIFSNKRKHTVVVVFKKTAAGDFALFKQDGGCVGGDVGIRVDTSLTFVGCGGSGGHDIGSGLTISQNIPYSIIVRISKNDVTNQVTFRVNGSTLSDSTVDVTNTIAGDVTIGSGGLGYYFSGQISEVIGFNRDITDIEIDAIQNYLSKKYSIKMQ